MEPRTMTKPNVIFILIDDMGWKDIACMGSDFYETPNIDKIRDAGMLFTDAYAACPVCSPTRASIMSGKYPARVGLTNYIGGTQHCKLGGEKGRLLAAPYTPHLNLNEKSLAAAFKENGYATWHIGKWHLGEQEFWPDKHGFDVNIGGCNTGHPNGKGHYFVPWDNPTIEPKDGDDYLTDRLGDEAADLIEQSDGTPFFMNLWFYQVHTPLMAKEDKVRKYEQKRIDMGLDKVEEVVEGDFFPVEHKKTKKMKHRVVQSHPVYAAMIEHLDENIGKVLDALETKGIADDTIIVFTSDNGGLSSAEGSATCNAPLHRGKGWMYEGGTREPTLIKWPGVIEPNSITNSVITSPDWYPTLLEACGLPLQPKQHVDGKSFVEVLKGEDVERGAIFWHFPHYGNQGGTPGCSIRKGDWKLIEFFEDKIELYNLKEDISEDHNVAEENPEIVKKLLEELQAWQNDVGALYPEPNPDWQPATEEDLKAID